MAKKWQKLLPIKQGLVRPKMPKNYPYKEPFLSKPTDNDLSKQWVVDYSIWSKQREKLVRKRVVIKGDSIEARLKDANEVIALLQDDLKNSAYIEPLEQPEPTISKVDLKREIGCKEAIDYYLDTINSSLSKGSQRTYRCNFRVPRLGTSRLSAVTKSITSIVWLTDR